MSFLVDEVFSVLMTHVLFGLNVLIIFKVVFVHTQKFMQNFENSCQNIKKYLFIYFFVQILVLLIVAGEKLVIFF